MNGAPVRLVDDPALAEELRNALREASDLPPQPFDLDAGLERLRQQIGSAGAPPATPGSSPRLAWKLGLGLGGAGAIGAMLLAGFVFQTRPASVPVSAAPVSADAPLAVSAAPAASSAEVVIDLEQDAPVADAGAAAVRSAASPSSRAETRESRDDLIRREVQHLAEVRTALASNPQEALRLAEQGHRDFARGMLYQEREALAIRALVRMGRTAQARARTEPFVARFPRSPYAEQLRRETGLSP